MRALILRALVLSVAGIGAACSGDINDFPTTPDPVIVTETFTGTINVNGASTHNVFALATTGTCSAVLVNDSSVVNTSLTGTLTTLSGAVCVRVYDVGALTEPVTYTFTVTHP